MFTHRHRCAPSDTSSRPRPDLLHLLRGQLEVEHVQVLHKVLPLLRLRRESCTRLQDPAEGHLHSRLVVGLANLLACGQLAPGEATAAERRPGLHDDPALPVLLHGGGVKVADVVGELVHRGHRSRWVGQEAVQLLWRKVAHRQALRRACREHLLERLPLAADGLAVPGRVVEHDHVHVGDPPDRKRLQVRIAPLLRQLVGALKAAGVVAQDRPADEELLPWYSGGRDATGETLLVAGEHRREEVAEADADGRLRQPLPGVVVIDLQAEGSLGEKEAVVEFHRLAPHAGGLERLQRQRGLQARGEAGSKEGAPPLECGSAMGVALVDSGAAASTLWRRTTRGEAVAEVTHDTRQGEHHCGHRQRGAARRRPPTPLPKPARQRRHGKVSGL
mmetsp:Transcript_98765/g.313446  ORF Transcript_98765/g.313446 Transcript_98765/m.313446 type:complete len:390 (+) Transcript_98765:136-1305(+)